MRRRVRHSRLREEPELNITPFMNLMVVLVPFLLLMAVFTSLSVVKLALPGDQIDKQDKEPPIQLEVVLRKDRIDIQDRGSDLLGQYAIKNGKDDYVALQAKLIQIKIQFPDVKAASILAEDDVDYGRIIETMDKVRSHVTSDDSGIVEEELFPDIALGQANLEIQPKPQEVIQ